MSKTKRKNLTLKQKYEIISALDKNIKASELGKKYGVTPSAISKIKSDKDKISSAWSLFSNTSKKMRKPLDEVFDDGLYSWFAEQRFRGIPINGPILMLKVNQIAKEHNKAKFNCTLGWIGRYLKRRNIKSGIFSPELNSVDIKSVENCLLDVWPKLRKDYTDNNVFNADETGLFYKMLPKRTLKFNGEKCHGGKLSEERLTAYFCVSMTGEKRKPVVIVKFKNPSYPNNQSFSGVKFKSNKNAWMTSQIFVEELMLWDSDLRKCGREILLLLDNCSVHSLKAEEILLTNSKCGFLPPNREVNSNQWVMG